MVHASAPQWDLPLVLEALVTGPFEPLERSSLKALSWKTALLLALTSAKRVFELTALSVHPSCLNIRGDQSGATLRPNHSFTPKSIRSSFRSRAIQLGVKSEVLSVASFVSHTQGEKITYLPSNKCLTHGYISF